MQHERKTSQDQEEDPDPGREDGRDKARKQSKMGTYKILSHDGGKCPQIYTEAGNGSVPEQERNSREYFEDLWLRKCAP